MTALHRASLLLALTLALLGIGAPAAAVNEAPVVFALQSLQAEKPLHIEGRRPHSPYLTTVDEVRWLTRPGAPGAAEALDAMTPAGRFTVLNDGLIEGVRALADGGVLVLLSDGKDENSATTLEDAARLASERGVRLVTVAAGRADERTLRRLALLTGEGADEIMAGYGRYAKALQWVREAPQALEQLIDALTDVTYVQMKPAGTAQKPRCGSCARRIHNSLSPWNTKQDTSTLGPARPSAPQAAQRVVPSSAAALTPAPQLLQ